MKRHGNLYNRIISSENLRLAYEKARRGKSRMHNVQRFERDVDANLERIRRSLQFELDGDRRVLFTGSDVLIEQVETYGDQIPFAATIKKIDRYYTLS